MYEWIMNYQLDKRQSAKKLSEVQLLRLHWPLIHHVYFIQARKFYGRGDVDIKA